MLYFLFTSISLVCFLLFGQSSCELMSLRTKLSSTSVFEKLFITSCSLGKALFMRFCTQRKQIFL